MCQPQPHGHLGIERARLGGRAGVGGLPCTRSGSPPTQSDSGSCRGNQTAPGITCCRPRWEHLACMGPSLLEGRQKGRWSACPSWGGGQCLLFYSNLCRASAGREGRGLSGSLRFPGLLPDLPWTLLQAERCWGRFAAPLRSVSQQPHRVGASPLRLTREKPRALLKVSELRRDRGSPQGRVLQQPHLPS